MSDVASDVIWSCQCGPLECRRWNLGIPSSRTSMMAIFEGGVEASRLEDVWVRRIWERSVEERRGRVAIV
jgi:hypothetical protein